MIIPSHSGRNLWRDRLMGRRHSVRAASVKAAVIRFTKLVFLKQVRVKRDQPHWLTDVGGHADRAAEFGRRAHHAPTARNFRFPRRKNWLSLPKRALLSWPGRSSRGERLRGKDALPPRCREANGGVAVVAAGAAMNRNGGHHAEVAHP